MSSFILKCLALVLMIVDHIGAVFFPELQWIRIIGRASFPIYAFLMAEGYAHTHSKSKYLVRLIAFAFLSEVPYDMLFYGNVININHQNILFELAAGFSTLWLIDTALKKKRYILFIPAAAVIASSLFLHFSYGLYGVVLIISFAYLRKYKLPSALSLVIWTWIFYGITNLSFSIGAQSFTILSMNDIQMYAVVAGLIFVFYNDNLGKYHIKWLFYIIYPLHLVILLLIKHFITFT